MGTIKTTNIEPIADNGTVTLGSSGDTFTLGSGVVQSNLNYPAFLAYLSAFQGIANNAFVKVQFNTEVFDTNGAYDNTTNYRFTVPTGGAGKYNVHSQCVMRSNSGNNLQYGNLAIYLNGSAINSHGKSFEYYYSNNARRSNQSVNTILDLSVGDYIEAYAKLGDANHLISGSGVQANDSDASSFFHAYRIGS